MAPSTSNYTLNHYASSDPESSNSPASNAPRTRREARDAIVSSLLQILEQPLGMLRDGTIGDEQMATESQLIPGSTFGKHLRHVHDHYRVLLDVVETPLANTSGPLLLDYDKRRRAPPLETCAKSALAEFERTQQRIREIFGSASSTSGTEEQRQFDKEVTLSATTPAEVDVYSSLGREMWFVCLHAIHHFALARVILVHELRLKCDEEFGVAPSTLLFREWTKAESKL